MVERHSDKNIHQWGEDELMGTNTHMLISIANSLKDIVDELKIISKEINNEWHRLSTVVS